MNRREHTPMRLLMKALPAAALLAINALGHAQAATIEIQNRDPVGVGFNDPTPATPVGGNTGTTLGEQRMNVYKYVVGIWEQALTSSVKITVNAGWEALTCDSGSAVLGSASPWNAWIDFPNAPKTGTWYPQALANKLSGLNLADYYEQVDDGSGYGNVDIKTQFNINLGTTGCLDNSPFYLGLDGQAGSKINFATTLLHELGHGMGFTLLTTNSGTGDRYISLPSVWEGFMYDNTAGKSWLQMTRAERVASAINPNKLAWSGANVATAAPQVLAQGKTPQLGISGTGIDAVVGTKQVGEASFGPALGTTAVTGAVARLVDNINGTGLACTALSSANAAAVAGKVALIDRGTCTFVVKVKNLQDAGAKAVLVADNVVAAISGLGGSDASITIPAVRILKADGDALKAALLNRVRGKPAPVMNASLVAPLNGLYAGADASARPLLYTPNPRSPGSSVSHWDTSLSPNQLMEPFINADLTTMLVAPKDMTVPLLKDLGW
jgi:hypothetical protein